MLFIMIKKIEKFFSNNVKVVTYAMLIQCIIGPLYKNTYKMENVYVIMLSGRWEHKNAYLIWIM